MKILMFSWRDIKNPLHGGAEVVIHEYGRRWVAWGHEVTIFASKFKNCLPEEVLDGVKVIRSGSPLTIYYQAWKYYRKYFRGNFDLIIEEVNGPIPWYSYFYVREPVIALIHQNGRDFDKFDFKNSVARYEFPPGINFGIFLLEPLLLRYYKKFPVLAMSNSTKKDFIDLNHDSANIHVIPEGIDIKPVEKISRKSESPTFMYIGRLKRSKRVEDAIKAIKVFKSEYKNVKLYVVGRGEAGYEEDLNALTKELGLHNNVKFCGYLDEKEKNTLLKKAHALVITSIREGWGLVVTEANAMGTPAIGYDVAGLRDSIRHKKTGLLVESGDHKALGMAMIEFMKRPNLRKTLTKNAWVWSKDFNWDRSAKVALRKIEKIMAQVYNKG